MNNTNFQKHSDDEIIDFYIELKGDVQYVEFFLDYYTKAFIDFCQDHEDFDEDPKNLALKSAQNFYFPIFHQNLQKGHSAKWAHEFAISIEDGDRQIFETYQIIKNIDRIWAQNELIIYCKSLGVNDPVYHNYFIYLMDDGEGFLRGSEKVALYYEHFNNSILKGKSVLFAHIYAHEQSFNEYRDSYCEAYAWAFEECILKSKSIQFRDYFIEAFAHAIANNYSEFSKAQIDKDFSFFVNPIIAEGQAREYCDFHQVENRDRFIWTYVNQFTNYYAEQSNKVQLIDKQIDDSILRLTLEKI